MNNLLLNAIIAEENLIIRFGLKRALEETEVAAVVGEYTGVAEMLPHLSRLKPDVVILGGSGNILSRCLACYEIQSACPTAKILTLTEEQQDDELRHLILSGASGCVSTRAGGAEITRSVAVIANGGMDFDPDALRRLVVRVPQQVQSDKLVALTALTERQTSVLALIAKGRKNKEIARELNISNSTVKSDIAKIKDKLALDTRAELAFYAARHGIS